MDLIVFHNKEKSQLDFYYMDKEKGYTRFRLETTQEALLDFKKELDECLAIFNAVQHDNANGLLHILIQKCNDILRGSIGQQLMPVTRHCIDQGKSEMEIVSIFGQKIELMFQEKKKDKEASKKS